MNGRSNRLNPTGLSGGHHRYCAVEWAANENYRRSTIRARAMARYRY
jgi:hypothetical protein